ncbi:MAG TPA: winged helix DNA-binding protein [Sphingobium sp.]|nr:winged helix DNA-binding protein [Sphingobium sp.]
MDQKDWQHRTWHLAANEVESRLTEFEYAMLRFREAFEHWVLQAMRTTSDIEMTFAELVILHTLRMQGRPTSGSSIARMLNRTDLPNIQYSLRKLSSMGLIDSSKEKTGKTLNYSVTPDGVKLTDQYAELKRATLLDAYQDLPNIDAKLDGYTRALSVLTGLYEESARAAATYSSCHPDD